jgi:hypothetical protein
MDKYRPYKSKSTTLFSKMKIVQRGRNLLMQDAGYMMQDT